MVLSAGSARPWLHNRLHYLSWYLLIQLLVMLVCSQAFRWQGIPLPAILHWLVIPVQSLICLCCFIASRRTHSLQGSSYLVLLLTSIALLAGFVYGTGGHTNPLISILLVPLAISAISLRWPLTVGIACLIIVIYTLLTRFYIPLTPANHSHHFMQLHLAGMWLTFSISVVLIVGLVLPLVLSIQRQEKLLSRQREKILQGEKLVTLATFAASAAHKLGTPLSTLALLTEDMKEFSSGNTEQSENLETMAQQIALCKTTLQDMMRKADQLRHDIKEPISLRSLLRQLREQFNLLHPQHSLRINWEENGDLKLLSDGTLIQALLNLLDNAVKYSEDDPNLEVTLTNQQLQLSIMDTGPGLPSAIQELLGEPFLPSEGNGLGLGLYLSHVTINRLGGTLSIQDSAEGARIDISLPREVIDP